MKAMIVDDEPLARREIRRMLHEYPWLEIVADAGNIEDAAGKIELHKPDVLFLDIHMAGGSGFDLLTRLVHMPQVVFTTAYDQHAVHAFEVNALDYLLKPIDPRRLAETMSRVRTGTTLSSTAADPVALLERLFVKDGLKCWFIPLREVRLLTSQGNFVQLSWGAQQPLLGRPLVGLEQRLNPRQFFRANRRQIINLDFVKSVEVGLGGRLHVELRDGPEVQISRRQARLFRERLSV